MAPRAHDRGGWPNDRPIDRREHQWMDWERQAQVLPGILARKGLMVTDELRRGIEALLVEQYESLSYHERWSVSLETLLIEKGILTGEEIDAKAGAIERRWS